MYVRSFFLAVFILVSVSIIFAEEFTETNEPTLESESSVKKSGDLWFCIGGDSALYSMAGLAYGGSLSVGYGTGSSVGIKFTYYFNEEKIDTLELSIILRLYLMGKEAYNGPFIQFMGGPSFYNRSGSFAIPSNAGMVSAGFCFGWRFLFFDRLYLEPQIRGGYPYIIGITAAAGVRF